MVPSSAITIAADSEHVTCGGFSLSEFVRLGNIEFIADYFDGLSLSPLGGGGGRGVDSSTTFICATRCGASTLRWAMTEDSIEEILTTTPRMESALAVQATMMVPPQTVAPWAKVGLPSERGHTRHGGSRCKLTLDSSSLSKKQRHGEASSPASELLLWFNCKRCRSVSPHTRRRGS
jgi:hypothetical protein